MPDTQYIAKHDDLVWVDKTGYNILSLVIETSADDLRLSLNDYLVIIKYIYRNGAKHLTGLRISLLNKFEVEHQESVATLSAFEDFCETATILQKKSLSRLMAPILIRHKDDISEHLEWVKNQKLKQALEGLFTMAKYVLENDMTKEGHCSDVIRETLHLIEQKLPSKK